MIWRHDDLQEDLAAHLRGSRDLVVWTNMQLGPSGSARPDVYTIAKSYSKFTPLAYECKISTADFRRDVTSGKWQKYLEFAAGVIFAVPAGLVKKEEVPPGCGLIVRHEEVWRMVKGPTLKHIATLPRDAWMKLMIDGIERQNRPPELRSANAWRAAEDARKRYGDKIGELLSDLSNAEYRLLMEVEKTKRSTEQLQEEERQRQRYAREAAQRELRDMGKAKGELCAALGIPEGAEIWELTRAARDAAEQLVLNTEMQRLRKKLARAQEALADCLTAVPLASAECRAPEPQSSIVTSADLL